MIHLRDVTIHIYHTFPHSGRVMPFLLILAAALRVGNLLVFVKLIIQIVPGLRVNLDATRHLLDACRARGKKLSCFDIRPLINQSGNHCKVVFCRGSNILWLLVIVGEVLIAVNQKLKWGNPTPRVSYIFVHLKSFNKEDQECFPKWDCAMMKKHTWLYYIILYLIIYVYKDIWRITALLSACIAIEWQHGPWQRQCERQFSSAKVYLHLFFGSFRRDLCGWSACRHTKLCEFPAEQSPNCIAKGFAVDPLDWWLLVVETFVARHQAESLQVTLKRSYQKTPTEWPKLVASCCWMITRGDGDFWVWQLLKVNSRCVQCELQKPPITSLLSSTNEMNFLNQWV